MPKVMCRCGWVFDLGPIPAKDEFEVIPEKHLLDVVAQATAKQMTDEQLFMLIDTKSRMAYICPKCGRIFLETGVDTKRYEFYKKEDDEKPAG